VLENERHAATAEGVRRIGVNGFDVRRRIDEGL
jgi:hypothetical protein